MTARPARRGPSARARLVVLLALGVALAGCDQASASFDLTSARPCEPQQDVRVPGARPELEALLPRGMIERAPDTVDSGWNCTESRLGTYWAHGVRQLWFAGATWDQGGGDGTVTAIFRRPAGEAALPAAWVEEFYESGAVASTKTENIHVTRPTMPGAGEVYRLDTLNDLSLQTLVVWPAAGWPDQPYVHVVIVATRVEPGASREDHDQRVSIAVEVVAGTPIT